jgi:hypothetical protein
LHTNKPVITKRGNNIEVDVCRATIQPNESMPISLLVRCITEETIEEYLEIMVDEGESLFVQVLGEVQKPKVYLNRTEIDLGRIYAGVKEVVENDLGKYK